MRILAAAVVVSLTYLAVAGASDVAAAISIGGVTPCLWAVVATIVIVVGRWSERFWVCAALGLLVDLNGFGRLGVAMMTYLLVSHIAISMLAQWRRQGPVMQTLTAAPIAIALIFGEGFGHAVLGETSYSFRQLCNLALWSSIYTSLLCAPLFLIRSWWRELSYDRTGTLGIR